MDDEEVSRLIQETLRIYAASVAGRGSIDDRSSSFPYGRVNDLSDRVPGLTTLKEVLELIPTEEKKSFIEACRLCPDLVRAESDPVAFLRREDYNVWAAARRLVKYWEFRQATFGKRAFLPLNLSGEGALNQEDVDALSTGFQAILPLDGLGRPVLMLDFSKVPAGLSEKVVERTFFFLRCVAAQSEVGQKHGYTGLVVYNEAFLSIQSVLRRSIRSAADVLPISPCSIYVIRTEKRTFFQMLRSLDLISKNLILVVGETPEEICSKMEKHHLSSEGLPSVFGGQLSDDALTGWIEMQYSLKPSESYTKLGLYRSEFGPLSSRAPAAGMKKLSLDEAEMDLYEEIDLLTDEQKGAYLEAMELCPDLVAKESSPKQFLRCEANDPSAAARRLVQYWSLRRDLFQERAFRPMDATGKGVFTKEEVGRLDKGFMRVLPPDVEGRPVIWWDRSYMTAIRSFEEALRWWFYIFSVTAEDAVAQEKGIMFMAVYKPDVYKTPIRQSSKATVTQMVTKAIPIASFETHVIALRKPGDTLDPELFNLFVERLGRNIITDIAPSRDEMARMLTEAGSTKAGIPEEYGGQWQREDDVTWRARRDLLESSRYLAQTHVQSIECRIIKRQERGLGGQTVIPSGSGAEKLVMKSIHALPPKDIVEYVYATRLDPDLVSTETDFARYLFVDKGDAVTSARKIVKYWKTKKEICGEKFINPINVTPESAISPMENSSLKDGSMVLLESADPSGQDALYIEDRCTAESNDWRAGLFFALHTILKSVNAKESSFSVFVRATKPSLYTTCVKELLNLAETVFPLRIAQIHLLFQQRAPESGHGLVHQGWVLDLKNEIDHGVSDRTLFHFAGFEDDTLESLVCSGFSKKALSVVMGSQRADPIKNHFEIWTRQEIRDRKISARPSLSGGYILQNALKALDEATAALTEEEKHCYLRAKSQAPLIVESESNPIWFLKFGKFNAWKAAARQCAYWKRRCEMFKERAFLPLNQTGEGALTKKEVTYLSSGYVTFLPLDNEGRMVICVDSSRIYRRDPETGTRIMFYWNHVIMGNELSVEKGVVLLIVLSQLSVLDTRVPELVKLCRCCFPFYAHSVHVIPKLKKKVSLDQWKIPELFGLFMKTKAENKHFYASDEKEVVKKLQEHGLTKAGIPESIGGDWSYEKFVIWQERRIRIEWDLPLGALDETGSSPARPMSDLTEEERIERKRRFNILHSRRKRRRDRVETEVLQKRVEELQEEQKVLRTKHEDLQNLLTSAKSLVEQSRGRPSSLSAETATPQFRGSHYAQGSSVQMINQIAPFTTDITDFVQYNNGHPHVATFPQRGIPAGSYWDQRCMEHQDEGGQSNFESQFASRSVSWGPRQNTQFQSEAPQNFLHYMSDGRFATQSAQNQFSHVGETSLANEMNTANLMPFDEQFSPFPNHH